MRDFLQGLVTNDVAKVTAETAIYAALLTPQGKYLHDFFVFERDGALCLDCEAARIDDLLRRLGMYKLRARVALERDGTVAMFALIGAGAPEAAGLAPSPGCCRPFAGGLAFRDPRLTAMGARAILPADGAAALEAAGFHGAEMGSYEALRIALGVPDSGRDLVPEKSLLLEYGFEELHGVDFEKGCYVGQEVTARMKHRGLVRKRVAPVEIDGPMPPAGAPVLHGDAAAGEMLSASGDRALALLRLDQVKAAAEAGEKLTAGDAKLVPQKPDWARY